MLLAKEEMFNCAGILFSHLFQFDEAVLGSRTTRYARSEMARLCLIKDKGPQALHLLTLSYTEQASDTGEGHYATVEILMRLGFAYCLVDKGMLALAVFIEHYLQRWLFQTDSTIAPLVSRLRSRKKISAARSTQSSLIDLDDILEWANSVMVNDLFDNPTALEILIKQFNELFQWGIWDPVVDELSNPLRDILSELHDDFEINSVLYGRSRNVVINGIPANALFQSPWFSTNSRDQVTHLGRKAFYCAFIAVSMFCDWEVMADEWRKRPVNSNVYSNSTPGGFLSDMGAIPGTLGIRGYWDARYLYFRTA